MEIAELQALGLGAPSTQSTDESAEDTFLTLMLAQLQNQDPMQPMENGDFLSQLAQFETAAGIDEMQQSFVQLGEAIFGGQSLQAASMIDRSVMVDANVAVLPEGGELVGAVQLPTSSSNVFVEIHDPSGQLVHTMELGTQTSGETLFSWDGQLDDGTTAPPGSYTVSARAEAEGALNAVSTSISSEVQSVLFDGAGGIILSLANGMQVPFNQVQQIS